MNYVKNNVYKYFYLNRVNPEGKQEYTIKIYSTDATDDNSIGIGSYGLDDYSIYPTGTLKVNGKEETADLTFMIKI